MSLKKVATCLENVVQIESNSSYWYYERGILKLRNNNIFFKSIANYSILHKITIKYHQLLAHKFSYFFF